MVRRKIKWKFTFFIYLLVLNVLTKSLPIDKTFRPITTVDNVYTNFEKLDNILTQNVIEQVTTDEPSAETTKNFTRNASLRQNIRPGQNVRQYSVELTFNGGSFTGRAVIDVTLEQSTRDDPILFHVEDLTIDSVVAGVFTDANTVDVDFEVDGGELQISPSQVATSYIIIINYSGELSDNGAGVFQGNFNDQSYMGMNLHPTNARRVFPCIDEPTEESVISFRFNEVPFTNIVANSQLEENSATQFRPLQGPPHLWGMVAHNFPNSIPVAAQNVLVFGRSSINQDNQASLAINSYFNELNEWTDKNYFEIVLNQDGRMNIFALPDTSKDWYALSTVCIWEPYIYMETGHSIKQRKTGLLKIAEAMSRQWFGGVIYPENWRHQWVINGLNTYAAYDIFKTFQADPSGADITMLDVNTLFVTDIIQESLLRDAYASAQVLELDDDIFDEPDIRNHMNGLLKYKSPAILRMFRLTLGDADTDFIKLAARALLNTRSLQTVNSLNFYDAINSEWLSNSNDLIDDVEENMEEWVKSRGYPIVQVDLRLGSLRITQEHFSFTDPEADVNYRVPLTYTPVRNNANFENIHPVIMFSNVIQLPLSLPEEEFVLFNIQGQGYYRVNYDVELWERILEGLIDEDVRDTIHPLNRATLVDDALNLARANRLEYDTAFRVVLTMEHDTAYAPWKAFVRNMNFLRKRLVALVTNDEELDPDIYLRMVRRTIGSFEAEIGFYPDPQVNEGVMISLTRGLVMDHACRANYEPCIAAAVDWFFDPNSNEPVVNPNIPHEIRPAVYCTMVREGDEEVMEVLKERLDVETSHYERVVILESLACSSDADYINSLLMETIASDSPYGVEERSKIFTAVAESSYENAGLALNFARMRTLEIVDMYGGAEKLEEILFVLADNMADADLTNDFLIWMNAGNNNLDDFAPSATRARDMVSEALLWNNANLMEVYEWIDENDAPRVVVSLVLVCFTVLVTLFNH